MFGFKKRPPVECLVLAGRAAGSKAKGSAELGSNLYGISLEEIDSAIRANAANSLLYVSFFTSIANYTLQDAFYDTGLAGPLDGMPAFKFHLADSKKIFEQNFAFGIGHSLDLMKYHDMALSNSIPVADRQLWIAFERWTGKMAQSHFEYQSQLSCDWVGFMKLTCGGQTSEATEFMKESFRYII